MIEEPLSKAQFSISRAKEALDYACTRGVYSTFLLKQVASMNYMRSYDTFAITDAILELEGKFLTETKAADEFKHLPLKGLYKKHVFTAQHIEMNLINRILSPKTSEKAYLCQREREIIACNGSNSMDELLNLYTFELYKEKIANRNMTGDWLIFWKKADQNHYLCIAPHLDGQTRKKEGMSANQRHDQILYDRFICPNIEEFPELAEFMARNG